MATDTQHDVRVWRDDGYIHMRGAYALRDWFKQFPGARWRGDAWIVQATPAMAARILRGAETARLRIDVDAEIEHLARRADAGGAAKAAQIDESKHVEQPKIRKADSWRHQALAYDFARDRDAVLFMLGMGVGKSKIVCDEIVNHACKCSIILCPVSVLGVWRREFAKWTNISDDVLVMDRGTAAQKVAEAKRFMAAHERSVIIVSYETARSATFSKWALSRKWDMAVLDESHRAKDPTGVTGRFVWQLGKVSKLRRCLSGTPMPHSPGDIFSQFRFLDPGIFGTSWTQFKARYAVMGGYGNKQIVDWLHKEELSRKIYSATFRVGREVLDLPPAHHVERFVTLGDEARRIYDELEDEMVAEIQGGVITAANALVKLLRLQQVASGYAVTDPAAPRIELDENEEAVLRKIERQAVQIDTAKRVALEEVLETLGAEKEPVVVFAVFKLDLMAIEQTAEALGLRYGELSGRSNCLTPNAQMPEDIDVLGVQWQSGGVGVDLTRAAHCVLYSTGFSLGNYEQGLARLHRPGQTRPVTYFHIVAEGTVDQRIYKALREKRDVIEAVLQGYGG